MGIEIAPKTTPRFRSDKNLNILIFIFFNMVGVQGYNLNMFVWLHNGVVFYDTLEAPAKRQHYLCMVR